MEAIAHLHTADIVKEFLIKLIMLQLTVCQGFRVGEECHRDN